MRVWDLPPERLCRVHLLGEHREIHAIWAVLTKGLKGYSRHPETKRWEGRLKALFIRHESVSAEMKRRGYHHSSPLNEKLATGKSKQTQLVNTVREQKDLLNDKPCECRFDYRGF